MWLASALSVSSRLWLGGMVQIRRARGLVRALLEGVLVALSTLFCFARQPFELLQAGIERVARAASQRRAGVSPAPFARGSHGRPSDQALRPATGDRDG